MPTASLNVVNQKGIDPLSLDQLSRAGILALRRAKRRNMERLTLACGGAQVNSLEDLSLEVCGYAEDVYEQSLGEEKYTFIEGVSNPTSCTILIKGQNPHTISQVKDAIRDGLRAVKNALEDQCVVPGAGAFEILAHHRLMQRASETRGKTKLGVRAFAEAMLVVPRTLAENSGLDVQDTMLQLQEACAVDPDTPVGLDVLSGGTISPLMMGIVDNLNVKRAVVHLSTVLASQLLLVDEVMRAGRGSRPSATGAADMMQGGGEE